MGKNILRLTIVVVCAVSGYLLASHITAIKNYPWATWFGLTFGVVFALIALNIEDLIRKVPLKVIIGSTVGLCIGLLVAKLIGDTFKVLESPTLKVSIYLILSCFFGYVGLVLGGMKVEEFKVPSITGLWPKPTTKRPVKKEKILDTSVIIDGRITDICEAGFLEGLLVVPEFVLAELQRIADSADHLKKARGRRGLDVLSRLKDELGIAVFIDETDYPEQPDVDSKLIAMAKERDAKLVTNDLNLTKVARLRGIDVLNVNKLANALRPVVLPGETLTLRVVKEGREQGQGVAFLEDGTMVVVADGRRHVGREVQATVTQILQTSAGRLIFTELAG